MKYDVTDNKGTRWNRAPAWGKGPKTLILTIPLLGKAQPELWEAYEIRGSVLDHSLLANRTPKWASTIK